MMFAPNDPDYNNPNPLKFVRFDVGRPQIRPVEVAVHGVN